MFGIFLAEGMNPFYQNIASFPTVVFTFLLLVCLLFWLVAVLGFVDIDALDMDTVDGDDSHPEPLAALLLRFGLNGVPISIILSLIALFGWIICYYAAYLLFAVIPFRWLEYLAGIPILLASLYVAVMITAQLIKPLRPLFRDTLNDGQKHILGQTAVVRTSRVDDQFGEAVLDDGGAGLILKVRASPGAAFKQGDRVVPVEYDAAKGTYRVVSEGEFLAP